MEKERLTGIKHVMFIVTLMLLNIMIMHDFVIFPITDALYTAFPDDVAGVNFILSGPALILVIASLVIPYILKFMSKKTLLIIGSIAYALTAVFGCAIESIPYMLFCRSISGIAYGIAQVTAVSIISDYWVSEEKRATFMGLFNAAQAGAGAVMGFMAGNFAVSGWQNAYNAYWIAVPLIVLIIFFLPRTEKFAQEAEDASAPDGSSAASKAANRSGLGWRFWTMTGLFALLTVAYMVCMNYFISVFVAELELGDTAFVGVLTSLGTIGSAVSCLAFGAIFSKLRVRTALIYYAGMAISILMLYLAPSAVTAIIACTLAGACFGGTFSYVYADAAISVPRESVARATGYVTAAYGIATFAATYIETALMDFMGSDMVSPTYIVFAILVIVCLVLEFARTSVKAKPAQNDNRNEEEKVA